MFTFKKYGWLLYSSQKFWFVQEDSSPAAIPSAPAVTPLVQVTAESKNNQQGEGNKKAEAMINSLDAKVKRAQRFGLPLSDEQMKQKRAER